MHDWIKATALAVGIILSGGAAVGLNVLVGHLAGIVGRIIH